MVRPKWERQAPGPDVNAGADYRWFTGGVRVLPSSGSILTIKSFGKYHMDIALVGAGIGGLTAAACLLRDGHRVRIYEQAGQVSEVGAAVQMSANAVKVLYHLGLKPQLEDRKSVV